MNKLDQEITVIDSKAIDRLVSYIDKEFPKKSLTEISSALMVLELFYMTKTIGENENIDTETGHKLISEFIDRFRANLVTSLAATIEYHYAKKDPTSVN